MYRVGQGKSTCVAFWPYDPQQDRSANIEETVIAAIRSEFEDAREHLDRHYCKTIVALSRMPGQESRLKDFVDECKRHFSEEQLLMQGAWLQRIGSP